MSEVKYPNITVKLVGTDGNAFAILGAVTKALRRSGVPRDQIQAFTGEATRSDYNQLLATCMRWVNVT